MGGETAQSNGREAIIYNSPLRGGKGSRRREARREEISEKAASLSFWLLKKGCRRAAKGGSGTYTSPPFRDDWKKKECEKGKRSKEAAVRSRAYLGIGRPLQKGEGKVALTRGAGGLSKVSEDWGEGTADGGASIGMPGGGNRAFLVK